MSKTLCRQPIPWPSVFPGATKNPEFYDFYRSLEAYRNSFDGKDDIMVLDANSDFFKYLRGSNK